MKLTLTSVEYSTLGSSNPGADVCGVCKSQLENTNKFYKPLAEMLGAFFMEAYDDNRRILEVDTCKCSIKANKQLTGTK